MRKRHDIRGETPITTSSLDFSAFSGARKTRDPSAFYGIQAVIWTAYAAMLTIPWIGTYTVASMIPNKILITSS